MQVLGTRNGQAVLLIGDRINRTMDDHQVVTSTRHWYSFKTDIHCLGCGWTGRRAHRDVPFEILAHRLTWLNVSLW